MHTPVAGEKCWHVCINGMPVQIEVNRVERYRGAKSHSIFYTLTDDVERVTSPHTLYPFTSKGLEDLKAHMSFDIDLLTRKRDTLRLPS